jgi:hypothetical protein
MHDDAQNNYGQPDNNAPVQNFGLGGNPSPIVSPSESPVNEPTAVPQVSLPDPSAHGAQASNDLEDIKNKALSQLSPLVSKLEQTPEEKFKTLMMMIQASDNQALLGEAYDAAQQITDEKAKAEALLNIVNEINYFTQKSQGN